MSSWGKDKEPEQLPKLQESSPQLYNQINNCRKGECFPMGLPQSGTWKSRDVYFVNQSLAMWNFE